MKKKRKYIAAILLASMMATSVAVAAMPAMAADPVSVETSTHTTSPACTHSLTVKQADQDETVHNYAAYQVLKGNYVEDTDGKYVLINIDWGSGVNSGALVQALYDSQDPALKNKFSALGKVDDATGTVTYTDSADAVAKQLIAFSEGGGDMQALAKVFNADGILTNTSSALTADNSTPPKQYSVDGLVDGWYFVNDTVSVNGDDKVKSANLLQLVGDTVVEPKYSVPFLDKVIIEDNTEKNANQVSIGDSVTYQITIPVPDMTGYNKYFYIVNDTLSKGLYYNGDLTIQVDTDPSKTTDALVDFDTDDYTCTAGTYNSTTGTDIKIVFNDCLTNFANLTGNLVLKYTAVLNENAVLTAEGNPNTADLTYSNDPNHTYEGKPGSPDEPKPPTNPENPTDGDVIGATPKDTVKTFTTGLELQKVIAGTSPLAPLKGAKFKIEGNGVKAVLINNVIYKEDANGTYYMLKDGSFTEDEATTATEDKYDSTTVKYSKINKVDKDTAANGPVNTYAYSNADGIALFTGLGAGQYTITEIAAPKGYNKLADPIVIDIEATIDDAAETCTWAVKKHKDSVAFDTDDDTTYDLLSDANTNNHFEFVVENNKGTTLPSTGGIGTTLFYVVGGSLVAGAVVLLITKKRMNASDEK